jgi:hypothetical protein
MDNFYCNCPPMMNDGRFLTNYKSAWSNNEYIKYVNGIVRNDDYRLFLQMNADKILNSEFIYMKGHDSCMNNACIHKYPLRMDPRLFDQERENANKLMKSKELPNSFKCNKYPDYRLTNTGMQSQYVPSNETKCSINKNEK